MIFVWGMMVSMTGHARVWVGAGVTALALMGLAVYFGVVGLDRADKWASVIGAFVAVIGLVLAVQGRLAGRGGGDGESDGAPAPGGPVASGERSIAINGDNPGIASTGDDATNRLSR
ncbi:hypothetical protein ACFYTC_49110 [Actinomadura nitritigenes]|uniref:hypothetical protein n=1 Tax=Actinomadura nitritigenes TaxID=134602 RepID=UPI0036A395D3